MRLCFCLCVGEGGGTTLSLTKSECDSLIPDSKNVINVRGNPMHHTGLLNGVSRITRNEYSIKNVSYLELYLSTVFEYIIHFGIRTLCNHHKNHKNCVVLLCNLAKDVNSVDCLCVMILCRYLFMNTDFVYGLP